MEIEIVKTYDYYDMPIVFLGKFNIDNKEKIALFMWTDEEEKPQFVGVDFDESDINKFESNENDLLSLVENKPYFYLATHGEKGSGVWLKVYEVIDYLIDGYLPAEGYFYRHIWEF